MKTYNGLLIIGDAFLSSTRPGRRLDDDFQMVALAKIAKCLSHAKSSGLKPIFVGSLTRKTFEVGVFSKLIHLLSGADVLVVAGDSEYKPKSGEINPHSTCKLLADSGIIRLAEEPGIAESILISTSAGKRPVCLFAVPQGHSTPANMGFKEGVHKGETVFVLAKLANERSTTVSEEPGPDSRSSEWPGVSYYVTNALNVQEPIRKIGRTTWLSTGPLVRTHVGEISAIPSAWEWTPETDFTRVVIEHASHVFDDEGFASKAVAKAYKNSEFTQLLKSESKRASQSTSCENFIENETAQIYKEINLSIESREIIDEYIRKTASPSNILEGVF